MYYHLNTRTDKEVGGIFPQANCLTLGHAHSIKFSKFAEIALNLKFELAKRSKVTDIISQSAISADGFIISERVKNILQEFNIIQHKYYEVIIQDALKRIPENYYWLHTVPKKEFLNWIDYAKSKFYRTKYTFRNEDIEISSVNDYYNFYKNNDRLIWGIEADEIKLNENFDKSLDMFIFPDFSFRMTISQKLKDAFIQEKISGIEITEAAIYY